MPGGAENGILIGLVKDLDDPSQIGRVLVEFPTLEDQPSDWCRLVTPMGGAQRGLFLRPEVGDEVVVAFEHGDPRRPYVLGGVWSTSDKPPPDDGQAKQNNWRFLRSRSGHIFKLDDTAGGEKIELIDKDGSHKIVIDSAGTKIQVNCDTGDVEIKAAAGSITIQANSISIKADSTLDLEASGQLTIKGSLVNIN